MRNHKTLLVLGSLLAAATLALGQSSKPSVTVVNSTGTNIVVAASTNAISLVSTGYTDGTFRVKALVQNTNSAGSVAIYKGTNTTAALEAVLAPGQHWITSWPTIYNGDIGARSTSTTPLPVIVSEDWGK